MTKQRNKFLNFWLSMIPGCGQMFMGFMKRGVSFMLYLSIPLVVAIVTDIWVLVLPIILVCFYAFFDSIALNGLPPEKFAEIKDDFFLPSDKSFTFLSKRNISKYIGVILVIIGIAAIWNTFVPSLIDLLYDYDIQLYETLYRINRAIPQVLVCIFAIVLGLKLMAGKKKEIDKQDD